MDLEHYRKIIHIDMDAFFASVEQRDHPELKGKPVAVGGRGDRGVVAAASYEARRFGVFSAMPSKVAIRKCPHLIFVPPRFEAYKKVSDQIRAIFLEYTDLVEPLSLDEAYLDVTSNKKGMQSATQIAHELRARIKKETQLTASAGISINKFLAKSASDIYKPDGITLIPPANVVRFLEELAIDKFYGIGKVTAQKMKALGISNGKELKHWSEKNLIRHFGKSGKHYYYIVRGIDNRPVNPDRIRKSVGAESTYASDITTTEALATALEDMASTLHQRISPTNITGKTLTIKLKFSDFKQITRSKTVPYPIQYLTDIRTITKEIMEETTLDEVKIRLVGISLSNLTLAASEKKQSITQLTLDF